MRGWAMSWTSKSSLVSGSTWVMIASHLPCGLKAGSDKFDLSPFFFSPKTTVLTNCLSGTWKRNSFLFSPCQLVTAKVRPSGERRDLEKLSFGSAAKVATSRPVVESHHLSQLRDLSHFLACA